MENAHFICNEVKQVARMESTIGWGSLSEGTKSETIILTITLVSSGNTLEIKNGDIFNSVINKLQEVK